MSVTCSSSGVDSAVSGVNAVPSSEVLLNATFPEARKEANSLPFPKYPPGAAFDGKGISFSVRVAEGATKVEVFLLEKEKSQSTDGEASDVLHGYRAKRIETLTPCRGGVWETYIASDERNVMQPGQVYAYRVVGPYNPDKLQFFDCSRLLLDPYAKASAIDLSSWDFIQHKNPVALSAVTYESRFIKDLDARANYDRKYSARWLNAEYLPCRPVNVRTYQLNVRGFSAKNHHIPESLRGTFAGLAHRKSIAYLKGLNVTHVQLQPIHAAFTEARVLKEGAVNQWAYNPLMFMAIHGRYCKQTDVLRQVNEVKYAFRELHRAGIGVIMDMVFPHTAEGSIEGTNAAPTFMWRGLNAAFYQWKKENGRVEHYDGSACGNVLDFSNAEVQDFIIDTLLYWKKEFNIDGCRFDQGVLLGQKLLERIKLHPELQGMLMVVEPLAPGVNCPLGRSPQGVAEMNFSWRSGVFRYMQDDNGQRCDGKTPVERLADCLGGNSDIYGHYNSPQQSVAFFGTHDGARYFDRFCFEHGNNWRNGKNEANKGNESISERDLCKKGWPLDMPMEARQWRMARNIAAFLYVSQGNIKMWQGDECGQSQQGNTNGFMDPEHSTLEWDLRPEQENFKNYISKLGAFRENNAGLWRRSFDQLPEIRWYNCFGRDMKEAGDWNRADSGKIPLAMYLPDLRHLVDGRFDQDKDVVVLMNPKGENVKFTLPAHRNGEAGKWVRIFDTRFEVDPFSQEAAVEVQPKGVYEVEFKSVAAFKWVPA